MRRVSRREALLGASVAVIPGLDLRESSFAPDPSLVRRPVPTVDTRQLTGKMINGPQGTPLTAGFFNDLLFRIQDLENQLNMRRS